MTVTACENIWSVGRRVTGCMGRVGNGEVFEIKGHSRRWPLPGEHCVPLAAPAVAVLGRVGREGG